MELNISYTVQRETIQWCLCAAQKSYKVTFCFLVCSLALYKKLPQKLLCAQQNTNLLMPVTRIIEGQKVKTTCCVTFSQFRDFLCTQHLCISFCGTFISLSKSLLLINLHLVDNNLLSHLDSELNSKKSGEEIKIIVYKEFNLKSGNSKYNNLDIYKCMKNRYCMQKNIMIYKTI